MKKEEFANDEIFDSYVKDISERKFWRRGEYKTLEESSIEYIEYELRNYRRYLNSSKTDNWKYADWKAVDRRGAYYRYIENLYNSKINEMYNGFTYLDLK